MERNQVQFAPNFVMIEKYVNMIFIGSIFSLDCMTIKLRCDDYGFECEFILDGEKTMGLIEELRNHFEEEHGIDYTVEAVIQMITNRGHSLESIRK